ncbi:MAG: DUF1549 and DUF1553 domain-containing protein [Phycisphaerae bacterium]|nr:DUF1549 and DUF1553 domain-containing protein [Phycisphaerae bacterium]
MIYRLNVAKRPFLSGILFLAALSFHALALGAAAEQALFSGSDSFKPAGQIDKAVLASMKQKGIEPANLCSDAVFFRRVNLDVIGTLPSEADVRRFLQNPTRNKRATYINMLLKRPEFADYWSLKWCDLLRVKSEFPINLWPNAVQAYHRWIRQSLYDNMPYDQFVRQLLTTSGSNFRYPQVNFYRAIQGQEPSAIATAAALNFMGVRLENWPESKRKGMEVFFSRVCYKSTAEWKEEIVYLDPTPAGSLKAVFPDGTKVTIKPGQDPRVVFADWLTDGDNKWFARNAVNRVWSWLFGRGIIDPADDIDGGSKAVYPEVLAYLEKELVESEYDIKHIFRLILNSSVYQQSSVPRSKNPNAEKIFACYPVRQLDAEVLVDALCQITGTKESYSSLIPEPFTFIPADNRSIDLADGSITSPLLEMFGRPSRDSGYESERNNKPSDKQRLYFLNSSQIQRKIEQSWKLKALIKRNTNKKKNMRDKNMSGGAVEAIYLNVLSRYPTEQEVSAIQGYFKKPEIGSYRGTIDLIWALINSKEFLYRH